MKQPYLFLMLLLLVTGVSAQDILKVPSRGFELPKVQLSVIAQFGSSHRFITEGTPPINFDKEPKYPFTYPVYVANLPMKPRFCYTVGLGVRHNLNKLVSLEYGVLYDNWGNQYLTDRTYDFEGQYGGFFYSEYHRFTTHFIQAPLSVKFSTKGRVRFAGMFGVVPRLFIKGTEEVLFIDQSGNIHEEYESSYLGNQSIFELSWMAGVGVEVYVKKWLLISAIPTFTVASSPMLNGLANMYLYAGGLRTSFYFGFSK